MSAVTYYGEVGPALEGRISCGAAVSGTILHLEVTASPRSLAWAWKTTPLSLAHTKVKARQNTQTGLPWRLAEINRRDTEKTLPDSMNKRPLVLRSCESKRDPGPLYLGSPSRYTPGVSWPPKHYSQSLQTKTKEQNPPVSLSRPWSHRCSQRDAGLRSRLQLNTTIQQTFPPVHKRKSHPC